MGHRPVILTFVGNYLPGYKAGGILRAIANTVDHLCEEFEFKIVTRDRDLGDDHPYSGIRISEWQTVGNALVYYLPPGGESTRDLYTLIAGTPHRVLYLNSFFDPLTIKALLNRKLGRAAFKPVIVAPWGEFAWASLKQKYPKKLVFILAARLCGLYRSVTWRASSEFEKADIIKVMKIPSESIQIAGDFPLKALPDPGRKTCGAPPHGDDRLKLVFLSRISPEKNLDYALRVLRKVNTRVVFDIYGPAENENYWRTCQELIGRLPDNVTVNYLGSVKPTEVLRIFGRYDLFLFPTGGEAFGHVIAECLISGTPVLISTETPWRNLQDDALGWDIDLAHVDDFVQVIEQLDSKSREERSKQRQAIKTRIMKRLMDPAVMEANRALFTRG